MHVLHRAQTVCPHTPSTQVKPQQRFRGSVRCRSLHNTDHNLLASRRGLLLTVAGEAEQQHTAAHTDTSSCLIIIPSWTAHHAGIVGVSQVAAAQEVQQNQEQAPAAGDTSLSPAQQDQQVLQQQLQLQQQPSAADAGSVPLPDAAVLQSQAGTDAASSQQQQQQEVRPATPDQAQEAAQQQQQPAPAAPAQQPPTGDGSGQPQPPQQQETVKKQNLQLTDEAAKKLLDEEEDKRKARRRLKKGRLRELEEVWYSRGLMQQVVPSGSTHAIPVTV